MRRSVSLRDDVYAALDKLAERADCSLARTLEVMIMERAAALGIDVPDSTNHRSYQPRPVRQPPSVSPPASLHDPEEAPAWTRARARVRSTVTDPGEPIEGEVQSQHLQF